MLHAWQEDFVIGFLTFAGEELYWCFFSEELEGETFRWRLIIYRAGAFESYTELMRAE